MPNETLEQKANAQPQVAEGKEKPKVLSPLENLAKEVGNVSAGIFKGALAVGMPLSLMYVFPDAALDIGAWVAANSAAVLTADIKRGKKHTMSEILKSSSVGTVTALPLHYLANAVSSISLDSALGYVGMAAALGGIAYPAFIALYQSTNYIIRNGIKGLGKDLRENYWSGLKTAWKILPLSLIAYFFAPSYLVVPIGAGLNYVLSLLLAPKKGELKESEKGSNSHLINWANPFYVASGSLSALGKGYQEMVSGVHYLGRKISGLFNAAAKPVSAAQPAAAPA